MNDQQHSFFGSLKWAFYMTWADRAFSVFFTFLLAAILGPRDFGIVALALIYIAVVQLLLEGGIQTAVVQREGLEDDHLDSAFWVNLGWCLLLAAGSFLLAGWWARLNGVPELKEVVQVLSVLLVIYGLTIVQLGLFQREMRFRALAIRETLAVIVGGVLGLVLALRGAGVWALVAQQLGFAVTQLVLLWAMSTWRPRFRFSRSHARDLVGFSSGVFLSNLGGFINRRADALLMGIFFGPTAVGLYRLADRFSDNVLELTMRPVGHVSLPFFSRLQNDRPALRDAVASCDEDDADPDRPRHGRHGRLQRLPDGAHGPGVGAGRRRPQAARARRDREGDRLLHRARSSSPSRGRTCARSCSGCSQPSRPAPSCSSAGS